MMLMKTASLDKPKFSTLEAKRRPNYENDEYWSKKRILLENRKELFVAITTVNNFVKLISHPSSAPVEMIENGFRASEDKLTAVLREEQVLESRIQDKAKVFVDDLHQLMSLQSQLEGDVKNLSSYGTNVDTNVHDSIIQIDQLESELNRLRDEEQNLESAIANRVNESEVLNRNIVELTKKENMLQEEREALKEIEGPQREQFSLVSSFLKLKTAVHEKLSGHQVLNVKGDCLQVLIREDGSTIDLLFDKENRLCDVKTKSFIAGSKVEAELRAQTVEQNHPALFVRTLKLLAHNSSYLNQEIQELRVVSEKSKRPFDLEYNASKRLLTVIFNGGSYAKLRIPLDYKVSMVELVQLDRPESSRSLNPVAKKVKESLLARKLGKCVTDWIMELNNSL